MPLTRRLLKLNPWYYKKLLHKNITRSYKESHTCLEKSINMEDKEIAAGIKLDDKVECMAKAPAYITLKNLKITLDYPIPVV